jgi:hypothetical protein
MLKNIVVNYTKIPFLSRKSLQIYVQKPEKARPFQSYAKTFGCTQ